MLKFIILNIILMAKSFDISLGISDQKRFRKNHFWNDNYNSHHNGNSDCTDYPQNWTSSGGSSCMNYKNNLWCKHDGSYGIGWLFIYGKFDDWADKNGYAADDSCCYCGGGNPSSRSYSF